METNMDINELLTPTGEDLFYSREFMIFLHLHRTDLISSARAINLATLDDYVYEGDFYGLLDHLEIKKQYHYATLIINRLDGPICNIENIGFVLIPDFELVEKLFNYYNTKNGFIS
jgi:hypothetical protein